MTAQRVCLSDVIIFPVLCRVCKRKWSLFSGGESAPLDRWTFAKKKNFPQNSEILNFLKFCGNFNNFLSRNGTCPEHSFL